MGRPTAGGHSGARRREAVTGALWPLPTATILLAIGLGIGLPLLDANLQGGDDDALFFAFSGGPTAARGVLGAIATSLISVTTLLFSLTIVTLQLASSQYSPRLLQTFARDRVVQTCLGTLLGTFVFALLVLRTVRSADESGDGAFVPRLSVTVAFGFTLACVAALVTFLSHQTTQLRVETMMREVHAESSATLTRLRRQLEDDDVPDEPLAPVPGPARPVCAGPSGFLVDVDQERLLRAATRAGAVLRVDVRPGDAVAAGTPVAWIWPHEGSATGTDDDLEAEVAGALIVRHERADVTDPSYGLRKLVDIAARALSPGINDPTTAVHALSHISVLLGSATGRDGWHRRLRHEDVERGTLRSWDFPELLDLGITQVRDYGRRDATVVSRLFRMLAEVAWRTHTPLQQAAVRRQCRLLTEQFRAEPPAGRTAADVDEWSAAVTAALSRSWVKPAGSS